VTERFLMCKPKWFSVNYVINPWMDGNISSVVSADAMSQWTTLQKAIAKLAEVVGINQAKSLPDMVFTANAALVRDGKAILSRFKHPERQGEEKLFSDLLLNQGFQVLWLPNGVPFEGAGDALFCTRHPSLLWMGYGHRTDAMASFYIGDYLKCAVVPLKLIDDRFYHLDTCFCPLKNGELLYYPPAFDEESLQKIRAMIPMDQRIIVSEEDALNFACNAVNIDTNIFLNKASDELVENLTSRGYVVKQLPLTEFIKAGGSAKCLTLRLTEN